MRVSTTITSALRTLLAAAVLVAAMGAPGVRAQAGLFAYPSAGQPEAQQRQDRFECHEWAVGQTGFDPMVAAAPAAPQDGTGAPPPQQRHLILLIPRQLTPWLDQKYRLHYLSLYR